MKLTIVLTLKNRVLFTYRWIKYMDDMKCPYKILIADGGNDTAVEQNLSNYKNYPNLDYEYIRYPYDSTIADYYIKFTDVISQVESEYMLLADNDDFYLLDHIPEIIAFLDTHKDYVGARGNLANLTLFDRNGKPDRLPKGSGYLAVAKEAMSIENLCPYERVENLCNNMSKYDYYSNWYCIFRTAQFQSRWKCSNCLPVKEVIVTEILTHVFMAMRGKIKIMPFPFYIRQSNTSIFGDTLVIGNEFLERCIINNSLSEFGDAVDQFIMVKNKEEKDRLLRAIVAWLEVFISNIYMERNNFFKFKKKIQKTHLFNQYTSKICHELMHLLFPLKYGKPIRLKLLEPYILKQSQLFGSLGAKHHED